MSSRRHSIWNPRWSLLRQSGTTGQAGLSFRIRLRKLSVLFLGVAAHGTVIDGWRAVRRASPCIGRHSGRSGIQIQAANLREFSGESRRQLSGHLGATDQEPAWLRERQWVKWFDCLPPTPRRAPELLPSRGRMMPAMNFRTPRGVPITNMRKRQAMELREKRQLVASHRPVRCESAIAPFMSGRLSIGQSIDSDRRDAARTLLLACVLGRLTYHVATKGVRVANRIWSTRCESSPQGLLPLSDRC